MFGKLDKIIGAIFIVVLLIAVPALLWAFADGTPDGSFGWTDEFERVRICITCKKYRATSGDYGLVGPCSTCRGGQVFIASARLKIPNVCGEDLHRYSWGKYQDIIFHNRHHPEIQAILDEVLAVDTAPPEPKEERPTPTSSYFEQQAKRYGLRTDL
jgi:hypothetical protein